LERKLNLKNKELKKQWKGVKARSEYKSALDELID